MSTKTKKQTTNGTVEVAEAEMTGEPIVLKRLHDVVMEIPIVGTAPLVTHRFDEKMRAAILGTQQGKPKTKEKRDPEGDFNRARYKIDKNTDGYPSVGVKAAIVNACSLFDNLTKVAAKQSLYVAGEVVGQDMLIPIEADEPTMREDTVRLSGGGNTDLRYRPQYWPWRMTLEVRFLPSVISPESVVALVDAAGRGGIGEWRPSAPKSVTGHLGTFTVDMESLGDPVA